MYQEYQETVQTEKLVFAIRLPWVQSPGKKV